ncbi:MAG: tRNA (cytidine(34)-2'-O)-methyltransferase [Mycoplasmatales bacterium]
MKNCNIVLFEPKMAGNVANIVRTAVATNASLHIIEPIPFDITRDHPQLKRASANYMELVDLHMHANFDKFLEKAAGAKIFFLTRYGINTYDQTNYPISQAQELLEDVYLVFGSEDAGIPQEILQKYVDNTFRIPMKSEMRSINLANCVALVTFDLMRQINFQGLENSEPFKKDYLKKGEQKWTKTSVTSRRCL